MIRGRIPHAPMSAPASPTRVKRNAVFASGVARRKSEAMARMAPAPAQIPSTAAMMGCGHLRIALTTSPVIRVKAMRSGIFMRVSGSMISNTSPPGGKCAPRAGQHDCANIRPVGQVTKEVPKFGVAVESQRILALGAVERDGRDPPVLARGEAKVPRGVIAHRAAHGLYRIRRI